MLIKLSLVYWRKHPAKLAVMVIIILSGITALLLTLLFVRSSKMQEMDRLLTLSGDYDYIAFDCKYQTAREIANIDGIDGGGIYERIEEVSVEGSYSVPAMAFADDESERIFHMSMLRGRSPESSDEIALDLEYAKSCGIYPYPGERIGVQIGGEHKELTLVGIFEQKNDYGNYNRYRELGDGYIPPMAMLDSSYFNPNSGGAFTAFCQKNADDDFAVYFEMERICSENGEEKYKERITDSSRRSSYAIALGTLEFGEVKSIDEAAETIAGGGEKKDIFAYIIPVFAVLIGVITVISLYQLMKNIFDDRMHNSGIMLSIGISKSRRLAQLVLEPAAVTLILLPLGMLLGGRIFVLISRLGGIPDALHANELIKAVTLDPWLTTTAVISISVAVVSVMFILRCRRATALQLLAGHELRQRKKPIGGRRCRLRGWFGIVFGSISFSTVSVFLLLMIGMSSMTFGLIFSGEYGRYRSIGTQNLLNNEMADTDYLAEKQEIGRMIPNIENRHDQGIPPQLFNEFVAQNRGDISSTKAAIVNLSGMLLLNKETDDLPALLSDSIITPEPVNDNGDGELSFEESDSYSRLAVWEATGYSAEDTVCSAPFVGIDEDGFAELEGMLAEGRIDRSAIADGSECIIAVSENDYESISRFFHAGDEITLSDILLSGEVDRLDTTSMSLEDMAALGELVYSDTITENGASVPATGYCMGKRHDIKATIGAIAVVGIDDSAAFYMQEGRLNIFMLPETFKAWGLPDCNYTNLSVKLNDGADIANTEGAWYGMLSGCVGMKSRSSAELIERFEREANGMKRIFIRLELMLVLLIVIGIVLALYSRLKQQSVTAAALRAIGMKKSRLAFISLLQNELLVIVSGLFSLLPIFGFQRLSEYGLKQLKDYCESVGSDMLFRDATTPEFWTDIFLYQDFGVYEIFGKEYIGEWLFVIILFALLAAAVSAVPILSQGRLKIIEDLKKE